MRRSVWSRTLSGLIYLAVTTSTPSCRGRLRGVGPPQGNKQARLPTQSSQAVGAHRPPGPQSASVWQMAGAWVRQEAPDQQKQLPSSRPAQPAAAHSGHPEVPPQPGSNGGGQRARVGAHRAGYWAKAGVLRLVRMGADQATAAPAPSLFSMRLREIRAFRSGSKAASRIAGYPGSILPRDERVMRHLRYLSYAEAQISGDGRGRC